MYKNMYIDIQSEIDKNMIQFIIMWIQAVTSAVDNAKIHHFHCISFLEFQNICIFCPQAEAEHEERYFGELEKKERMEDKMAAIKEVQVTLFHCAQVCDEKHEIFSTFQLT